MKIKTLSFSARVLLGSVELSAAAYHQLQVGDILLLDQKAEEVLQLKVEEDSLFDVTPGLINTRKAVKIEKVHERFDP
jgi:flagellar motor switch protein FliM